MQRRNTESSLADILFPSLSEEELSDSILNIPPEQRRLHTDTYDFSISTILDYLDTKNMYIPEFQRKFVWTIPQASRLIESLIIQCPIPVIYLSQERDERLAVIDGNQRLKSIQSYINNEFELKGLTAYPELEGQRFFELDVRFQRHIMNRTLRCIVITKDTHPQVKFDVFERLNSGAIKLTSQELRHGIYHGSFMKLIEKLNKSHSWRDLLVSNLERRMKSEELIIRFLAMHYGLESYKKPLSNFLNNFAETNRELPEQTSQEFKEVFERTVKGVHNIYGRYAFKVFDERGNLLNNFNAALFDAEMLSVSRLTNEITFSEEEKSLFYKDLVKLFQEDSFSKAVTRATSDSSRILYRVNAVRKILEKHL
ncbi:MAG: DUF262 domain-containing protein [Chloroflexi bacterium]|nr:DUF262 domain-containing protein [Chloroflexota bacterium]